MHNILWITTVLLLPILAAMVIYQLDTFDPAPYPDHELVKLNQPSMIVPYQNGKMLNGSERIAEGQLLGPEDVAYDPKTGVIYTGTRDGWINRVKVSDSGDSVVEKWVNTGGQPLGLTHGFHGEVIVADADKGLLSISKDGEIELLTDEADGLKFKLTDAVDIARDGTLYFSDASYKYTLHEDMADILEARPYGRLLSYDPSTKQTKVLVKDLYFANGVAVSPDQSFVIICETPMRRCKKYYIAGEKKGSVEIFVENLPGVPDNIRYDGEGRYWIALPVGSTKTFNLAQRYPFLRKLTIVMAKYGLEPKLKENGGVIAVNLEGKPIAYYYDKEIAMMTSGIKIGKYLYCGSVVSPYMLRLDTTKYPAIPTTD